VESDYTSEETTPEEPEVPEYSAIPPPPVEETTTDGEVESDYTSEESTTPEEPEQPEYSAIPPPAYQAVPPMF
ncbi:hypothetical protein GGF46_003746, partial [Coemansia sp. RSA 552]